MKKSDITILNRVMKELKKERPGLMGTITGKYGYNYYMNMHMILATTEAVPEIEPAKDTFDLDKMFDTFNMELIDITIDLEALKAFKKENKKAKNGSRAPYIIKINDNDKYMYLGFNPCYVLDILTFTGTDTIKINAAGLKTDKGYYNMPFYVEAEGRKGLCLPINVNPKKADFTPEVNQEVDLLKAKGLLKGEYKKAVQKETEVKQEAAPEVKQENTEVKADDPKYLMAVWYAENVILKKNIA